VVGGVGREVVRSVEDARKSAGWEVADRIKLAIRGSPRVEQALRAHRDYIIGETLAAELTDLPGDGDGDGDAGAGADKTDAAHDFTAAREVDGERWELALSKFAR